jgi:hypothetical protein
MRPSRLVMIAVVLFVAAGVLWVVFPGGRSHKIDSQGSSASSVSSLPELLSMPQEKLSQADIGRMNLLCAQGLPGTEDLKVETSLAMLDQMGSRVRTETQRHFYRFQRNPGEFESSEGFFRMLMLAVVLAEDFQVHYAPDKIGSAAEARMGDGFFADAHDVFLHGLTGPKRQGTCSSLPVLQVAVGRRLGYPLKLVTTKGHLFVRWEDARERFNIEAAGHGVNRFSDDYYRHWPAEVSDAEVKAEGYLKSLTAAEELAVFLSIRGMCWREAGRYGEAMESFRTAARLSPGCQSYRLLAADLQRRTAGAMAGGRMN